MGQEAKLVKNFTLRSVYSPKLLLAATTLALIAVALTLNLSCRTKAPVSKVKPFVRGYIAVRVPVAQLRRGDKKNLTKDIFLPRVKVHLVNQDDNSTVGGAATDLSGRFTIHAPAGRYRVCWEADGFDPGCAGNDVSIGSAPVHVSTVRIDIKRREGSAVVFGNVKLSDGSSVRLLEPLADINAFGRVSLLDSSRTDKHEVLINNFGDYLVPVVPTRSHLFLAARAENGEGVQELLPQANLAGAQFHEIDLTIPNAPPRVDPLVLKHSSGDKVQVAAPGETLKLDVVAKDPDGDAITIRWIVDPGSGGLNATTGPNVEWKVPQTEGLYSLAMVASDGKGGYTRRGLSVRVDPKGVLFSGRVTSVAGQPIDAAQITINGEPSTSNSTGFFRTNVKASKRYVVNVRKRGFSFLSRIFDRGVAGGVYTLRPASIVTIDSTKDNEVVDKRSGRDCPGPASFRFDAKIFPGGVTPIRQDGKGNVIALGKESIPSLERYRGQKYDDGEGCGPGVKVKISANTLADGNGAAPSGPVEVSLSTIDLLTPDQMPGDYTVEASGGTRVMESFGAATVEFSSGGTQLNLRPGATAELSIPVDRAQLAIGATLPATIPILFYDEQKGVWKQDTTATLQGNVYVAQMSHFTPVNTDVLKVNQACVRVDASNPGLPGSFKLQVIVPLGANAPRVLEQTIDNSLEKEHVVYNLPSNTNITLAPYNPTTSVPYGTFIVNTGGAQNPTDPNLPFGPPYLACSTLVVLSPQTLPEDPIGGEFLHGLFSFNATTIVETDIGVPGTISDQLNVATNNYYARVDPNGLRQNLDGPNGFKTVHGLSPTAGPGCTNLAAGETCAIYANSGDLGFGREMHCKKNGANVGCYVTNYGNIDTPDSDDVVAAVDGTEKIATVAMENAPIENDPSGDMVVKFFVYVYEANGNPHPEGVRVNAANLDGKGARPVPQLCMVCHGGAYPGGSTTAAPPFNTVEEAKLGSEFLAFDLHNFSFAAAPFDKASQQDEFKILNEQMVLPGNSGTHTQLYVAEMYDGDNGVPATDQEELLVIDDTSAAAGDRWTAQPLKVDMYKHVIGNACRTCHATNPTPQLQFNNAKQILDILGNVESRVCSQHVMPHAKVTHELFWNSVDRPDTSIIDPHQPGLLQTFGDAFISGTSWQGNLCGVFTGGLPTPASAFNDIQTQILNPLCSGCHSGSSPAGNLNLQAANSYAQLVGVASCERPSMQRVQAGSANDSFLYRKLEGTHTGLSGCSIPASCNPFGGETGCGQQMPWSNPGSGTGSSNPLSASQLTLIRDWINVGAPN